MAYSQQVLDHFEHPRNVGSMNHSDSNVGTGLVGSLTVGTVIQLHIRTNHSGIIEDAKFKTYGCGSTIASSSLVTEWLKGQTLEQATHIKSKDIAQELALPPEKMHCAVRTVESIEAAIKDLQSKL